MEDITDVCRLCLEKKTLVWIFDTRINVDDMKNIIYVTTGVEISCDDEVSQKVCSRCLQIAAKMYEFRLASQKSDSTLKDKHKLYVEQKLSSLNPNTAAKKEPLPVNSDSSPASEVKNKKPALSVHPSIKEISAKHLNILIPRKCLKLNMLPVVSMPMNEVETYFEKRNIDFHKHARQVLRSLKRDVDTDSENVETSNCTLKNDISENTESQPSKLDVVMPIKIATNKTGYTIVSKAQPIINADDEKNKCIDETASSKRKLSETETESPTISKKMDTKNDNTSTLQIGKSVPTYICDICNSVQYSLTLLNKHKLNHLICQFCKLRFKSLEKKQQHVENKCTVKNLMSSCLIKSNVMLEKIELNRSIRAKYPHAFESFPPLPATKNMGENSIIEIVDDDESDSLYVDDANKTKTFEKLPPVDGIYKINANGFRPTTENNKSNNNSLADLTLHMPPSSCSKNNDIKSMATQEIISSVSVVKPNIPDLTPHIPPFSCNINNDNKPVATQEVITSVSVVKPNIKIKNNSILDYMDPKASDIKLMRDFLTRYKNLDGYLNQSTQTELLVNSSIVINQNEVTTEFKGLKNLLHFYKIPVIIKNGQFSVSYTCDSAEEKKKNMYLWDSLEPVDIAEPRKMSATQVPKTQCVAQNSCTTTLNASSVETISNTSMINYQNSENVTLGIQKENCQSETSKVSAIIGSSATSQLPSTGTAGEAPTFAQILSMTAQDPNSGQKSNNLLNIPRSSALNVLQSAANSSNIISSIANANLSETGGPLTKAIPYPVVQSTIPTVGQPITQSLDTFQPKIIPQKSVPSILIRNEEPLPPQPSGSSVHFPVQLPQRDLQPTINKIGNVPQMLPVNSAKENTFQVSSENITVGETPLPAPGSIRVKSLIDLT